jgi:hypothetical protein
MDTLRLTGMAWLEQRHAHAILVVLHVFTDVLSGSQPTLQYCVLSEQ